MSAALREMMMTGQRWTLWDAETLERREVVGWCEAYGFVEREKYTDGSGRVRVTIIPWHRIREVYRVQP